MNLETALKEMREFLPEIAKSFEGGGSEALKSLEGQFGRAMPVDVRDYVENGAPKELIIFETMANPLAIYGLDGERSLGPNQDGYSVNGKTGEKSEVWSPSWFLFADEGADPVIVDLSNNGPSVRKAMHGAGEWEFWPIADSIGQFLLCAAAVHHITEQWGEEIADEDELPAKAVDWIDGGLKKWAGAYHQNWHELLLDYYEDEDEEDDDSDRD